MKRKSKSRSSADFWNWSSAKHLLNRAGFGGKPTEVAACVEAGLDASIEALLDFNPPPLAEPGWMSDYNKDVNRSRLRNLSQDERRELTRLNRRNVRDLQVGLIRRMIDAKDPSAMLWEKMKFFWHSHFATSARKVRLAPLIQKQLSLFHQQACGSFRELLHGISRDPAMLRYLDNHQNRKGKPNENFARELMELFSLGPGNYSEEDVKESARAFSGWAHDATGFRVLRRQHDYGRKTFLGRSGNFDGEDIVDIILEQPACAEFITGKLLAFLGCSNPSVDMVESLANRFRDHDYALAPLLREIFSHPGFYSDSTVGTQIKSPIQLVVGTMRTLGVKIRSDRFYLQMLEMMGQVPYLPPNVKGWPGGNQWIDTSRLLARYTFAQIIGQGEIPAEMDPRAENDLDRRVNDTKKSRPPGLARMMRGRGPAIEFDPYLLIGMPNGAGASVGELQRALLSVELTDNEREALISNYETNRHNSSETEALRLLIGDIMTLPGYQLC